MSNNSSVFVYVTGTVIRSNIHIPKHFDASGTDSFNIGINNPDFSHNKMDNPVIADAVQKLQARVQQPDPTKGYNSPSLWVSTPTANKNGKVNKVQYYDFKTSREIPVEKDAAEGAPVQLIINTYNNDRAANGRAARLSGVVFADASQVSWYSQQAAEIAGFATLEQQGLSQTAPLAGGTSSTAGSQAAPQPSPFASSAMPASSNATSVNPFTGQPDVASAAPQSTAPAASTAPQPAPAASTAPQPDPTAGSQAAAKDPFASSATPNPFASNTTDQPKDPFAGM